MGRAGSGSLATALDPAGRDIHPGHVGPALNGGTSSHSAHNDSMTRSSENQDHVLRSMSPATATTKMHATTRVVLSSINSIRSLSRAAARTMLSRLCSETLPSTTRRTRHTRNNANDTAPMTAATKSRLESLPRQITQLRYDDGDSASLLRARSAMRLATQTRATRPTEMLIAAGT